jgi:glycosyltransferase involved in cell wall biosynthesis
VAARLARRPLIWHLHDILSLEHFSRTNIRLDVALANHLADKVITVSEAAKTAFVEAGGRPTKVKVVHNGIDAAPFLNVDKAKASQEVRSRLRIGPEPLLGCFSRLAPWKGQHVVIEALAELQDVHAMFVGGELFSGACHEETLRELSQTLGVAERVHFVGQQNNIPRLMQGVDIVVHPSTAPEPFARVLIEGLLAARPLVAAANGGTPEIIDDGANGLLFLPKDSADLARAIRYLLETPEAASAMASRARTGAIANFGREAYVTGISDEICNAANVSIRYS